VTDAPDHRIETERLRLRPLAATDADALLALDADPEVRRHVDRPEAPTRLELLEHLPRMLRRYGSGGEPTFWAAEEADGGAFCGWFHLRPLEEDPVALDLGYRLRREAWGRGLATEGGRHLVDRAFRLLGAERIVAHTLEANYASRHVLEKLGFREQGRYLHRDLLPAVAYALRRDWHPAPRPG